MKLAIVGVTGMVGKEMLEVLSERNFPLTELIPVASEKSCGNMISYLGKKIEIVSLVHFVIFPCENSPSD